MYSEVKRGTMESMHWLMETVNKVFGSENSIDFEMGFESPFLFTEENIKNTFYIDDGSKSVSQASVLLSKVSLNGVVIDVASLGSVCTLKEHRHNGLSTKIINEIIRVFTKSKVDLLLVSGEIELYKKLDCVRTGSIYIGVAHLLKNESDYDVRMSNNEGRIKNSYVYQNIHKSEKLRFLRTEEDFNKLMNSSSFNSEGYIVKLFEIYNWKEEIVAYAVIFKRDGDKRMRIMEYAGSRYAIMHSLGNIMEKMECTDAYFNINTEDLDLMDVCSTMEIRLRKENIPGTVRILDSNSIIQKLTPLINERTGGNFELKQETGNKWNFTSKKLSGKINGYGELTSLIFNHDRNSLGIPLMFTDDLNYI